MLSFRQKILISNIIVVLIFLGIMYPLAYRTVNNIIVKALGDRAADLIEKIEVANDLPDMITRLKKQKSQLFFRVSLIDENRGLLYDTHAKKLLGDDFQIGYTTFHPEVEEALKYGIGYAIDYSTLLQQELAYAAKRFDFQGQSFVIRTAFPFGHVQALTRNVQMGFLALGTIILFLFTVMTWLVIQHFTQPVQTILHAIRQYKEGDEDSVPQIQLSNTSPKDDFFKLANTLNSLSQRIQKELRTLRHERNEKAAILESLNEGVIAVDKEMDIAYANDIALAMLNVKKRDVLDKNFSCINKPHFYDLIATCQGEDRVCTTTATLNQHPKIHLDVIAVPKREGAILVLQDKSSHYRMLEMRKDFIANASHELKTPITIIQGFAEALHENPQLPLDTRSGVTLKIVQNCQRMTTIIKNLLTLADIENLPSSRLQKFDLHPLIEECCSRLLVLFPDAQVDIHKETNNSFLTADPDLLEVALGNLIDNAAKYSEPPAKIKISIQREPKYLIVTIKDSGIGIPKKELENIFERFYTVTQTKVNNLKSSGLGLSIVSTIIEKHFGKITLSSTLGEGTTFKVYLPINPQKNKNSNAAKKQ